METKSQASTAIPPLAWVAGIALILFSAVGIGAIMGWIPTSMGSPSPDVKPAIAAQPANAGAAGAPVRAKTQTAPAQTASNVPARATIKCAECGVIESVREIESKGEGSGLGAVGGAVVGGVLGNQVGGGRGKDVMTVVGAVGGAVAGNEVEKRVKSSKSYVITIRLDDGSSRAISEATAPTWRAGDKVKVINGVIQSNA